MNEIAIYKPQTAIEARRNLVNTSALEVLSNEDKAVFVASTREQIGTLDERTLVNKLSQMFRFIAMDIGYNIPSDTMEWQYTQTRITDILKRYYYDMTLQDIKTAFELLVVGALDAYLPKDGNGNPDTKHYQRFNADYIGKVLKAYKLKQKDVFAKVYHNEPKEEINEEEVKRVEKERITKNKGIFYRYKYKNVLDFGLTGVKFVYDWLATFGLVSEVVITEQDRQKAFTKFVAKCASGLGNKYECEYVRRTGTEANNITPFAYDAAMKREVREAFDYMIEFSYPL